MTNAAIHRVSEVDGRVCLFVFWFTVDRKGLSALAMTRCVKNKCAVSRQHTLCHCKEGEEVTNAAIHRVSKDADDLSLRVLAHSGSPRTFQSSR